MQKHMKSMNKNTAGFTLIETIVFVVVLTLIMIALMSSLISMYGSNRYSMEQASAVNSARKGIEQTVKHIREATFSDTGAYPIESMSDTAVTFYSNIDDNYKVEQIRLFLEDTAFKKGIIESSGNPLVYDSGTETVSVVSEDVRNTAESVTLFQYYDTDGNEITDYANITAVAFMTIRLVVNVNPSILPNNFSLYSTAALRNMDTVFRLEN